MLCLQFLVSIGEFSLYCFEILAELLVLLSNILRLTFQPFPVLEFRCIAEFELPVVICKFTDAKLQSEKFLLQKPYSLLLGLHGHKQLFGFFRAHSRRALFLFECLLLAVCATSRSLRCYVLGPTVVLRLLLCLELLEILLQFDDSAWVLFDLVVLLHECCLHLTHVCLCLCKLNYCLVVFCIPVW